MGSVAELADNEKGTRQMNLIDFILDLFRNESAAQAYVADPVASLADAGLSNVSPAQLQSAAASIPGLALGGGDPISGLQQAVSNQYGFAPIVQQGLSAPVEQLASGVDAGLGLGGGVETALDLGLGAGGAIASGLGLGVGADVHEAFDAGVGVGAGLGGNAGLGLGAE